MSFERVAELSDLWIGELKSVRAEGRSVLLVRFETGIVAYEDRCPHQAYPLSRGELDGRTLRCAAHGWEFDLATGRGVNPASCRLVSFPVRIAGESIWVDVGGAT